MNDPVLICRHAFGVIPDKIGEIAILMERDRTEQYKGALDRVLYELKGGVYNGITGVLSGTEVSIIYSKGPADIADCVAFLGMAKTKCKTIFSTGSIGGLGDAISIVDFVLADDAVGNDGYSQFVSKRKGIDISGLFSNIVFATGSILQIIENIVANVVSPYGVQVHRGRIFTTPGVSLEDENFLREIVEQGCIAIDMETAQFYTACREFGFDSATVHWVTDLPLTRSFFHRFRDTESAQDDWDIKHLIWLNMANIITAIIQGYIKGGKAGGET